MSTPTMRDEAEGLMVRSFIFSKRTFANDEVLLYRWTVGRRSQFLTRVTVPQFDVFWICRRYGPGRYFLHLICKNRCEYQQSFRIACGRRLGASRRWNCWVQK